MGVLHNSLVLPGGYLEMVPGMFPGQAPLFTGAPASWTPLHAVSRPADQVSFENVFYKLIFQWAIVYFCRPSWACTNFL